MRPSFLTFIVAILLMASCQKKTADTPAVLVPERLVIKPGNGSVVFGGSVTFTNIYFNTSGDEEPVPAGVIWAVSNTAIATISQQGIATGVSAGQTEITATYKTIVAKALLTVVAGINQIAVIEIVPNILELKLDEVVTLVAVAKNINGDVLTGKIFMWETDSARYAIVNTATGQVTAKGYGTANISVSAEGIKSSPAMVQVIRIGNFGGMGSTGTVKLKIENEVLMLETSAGFSVSSGPPDLRIYLGNSNNNINGAEEIASLNIRNGMQSWNIPESVNILQYRYVIIWCKQFGGTYGVADLGN